ncbi:hypothetical protein HBI38_073000 [Parastagonospora nodorum]|nr:hypothetical protein HBI73_041100 [Parastagonospora nodorum]KAH5436199.1 hypothetical protein HBI47_076750 [Parastagonospora nodorum]KAH5656585.1 hypothetical protein HBI23_147070 [Parastagonospora nodorum]KAH6273802.1 hypothetical protein HBI41_074230 [Parastagonospora nodorum]KAH6294094.1 hypothetical protein HBI40_065280 [Parastagonospora nodorum]
MMKRAESIARALRSNGCAKGSVVATYQERNPDWICSVLGIWHAGAICLPLDIGLPASRLVAIVHHCEPRFVLRQGETIDNMVQEAFNASGARIASMSELTYCKNAGKAIEPDFSGLGDVYAKDPAMILYTSGSTGTPKGIILQHEGLRNWIEAVMQLFEFEIGGEVTTQATLELFASLGELDNCGSVPRYFNVYGPTETTIGHSGTLINYLGDSVSQ